MTRAPLIILIGCIALLASLASGSTDEITVEVRRVSERVAVFSVMSNNVTVIATAKGLVVVDTHRSPGVMKVLVDRIVAEFGRDDFACVINTHGHWDHCSGNQVFRDSRIVGHANCPTYIRYNPAGSPRNVWSQRRKLERLEENIAIFDDADPARQLLADEITLQRMILDDMTNRYVPTPPRDVFEDRTQIDMGDLTLDLVYCGAAHTEHDVFVFVAEENVLLTGDVICARKSFCFAINALTDGDRLLSAIDEFLSKAPERIVVIRGHGEFLGRNDLVTLRDILDRQYGAIHVDRSAAAVLSRWMKEDGVQVAFQELAMARMEDPRSLEFSEDEFYELARRLMGRGKSADTIRVLELALSELPESAALYDVLAEAYMRNGKSDEAIMNYEMSLELEPMNRNAIEMLDILRGGE